MWGRTVIGELEISGNILYTETEQIFNATSEMWLSNGWKSVYWDPVEDTENEYEQVLEETGTSIFIHWKKLEV